MSIVPGNLKVVARCDHKSYTKGELANQGANSIQNAR